MSFLGMGGTALDKPAYDQHRSPSAPTSGGDMQALWALLANVLGANAQHDQQQSQLKSGALFGRHLGMDGTDTSVTPSNPTGSASNPWAADGLFHGGFSAQLTPGQIAQSQGGTAVNQWKHPEMFSGSRAPYVDAEESAVRASPAPFHISGASRQAIGLPPREPDLHDWYGVSDPMAGYPRATMPRTPINQRPKPAAGPLGSPTPGYSFGWPLR